MEIILHAGDELKHYLIDLCFKIGEKVNNKMSSENKSAEEASKEVKSDLDLVIKTFENPNYYFILSQIIPRDGQKSIKGGLKNVNKFEIILEKLNSDITSPYQILDCPSFIFDFIGITKDSDGNERGYLIYNSGIFESSVYQFIIDGNNELKHYHVEEWTLYDGIIE